MEEMLEEKGLSNSQSGRLMWHRVGFKASERLTAFLPFAILFPSRLFFWPDVFFMEPNLQLLLVVRTVLQLVLVADLFLLAGYILILIGRRFFYRPGVWRHQQEDLRLMTDKDYVAKVKRELAVGIVGA